LNINSQKTRVKISTKLDWVCVGKKSHLKQKDSFGVLWLVLLWVLNF